MSNIKYTSNINGEGGWLTGIEGDPVAVDAAPGAEGWEPVNLTIDANENGDIEVEYTKAPTPTNNFVVTFSGLTLMSNATCSKSWEEITNAIANNNNIIAIYESPNNSGAAQLTWLYDNANSNFICSEIRITHGEGGTNLQVVPVVVCAITSSNDVTIYMPLS